MLAAGMFAMVGILATGFYIWYRPLESKKAYAKASMEATKSTNLRHYDQAKKDLENYIKTNPSAEDKYAATLQLATVYLNQKDYQGALRQYRLAEKMKTLPDSGSTYGIALTSDKLNDKPTAIEYYQKSIKLLKTDDPGYAVTKSQYEARIKALNGK